MQNQKKPLTSEENEVLFGFENIKKVDDTKYQTQKNTIAQSKLLYDFVLFGSFCILEKLVKV